MSIHQAFNEPSRFHTSFGENLKEDIICNFTVALNIFRNDNQVEALGVGEGLFERRTDKTTCDQGRRKTPTEGKWQ